MADQKDAPKSLSDVLSLVKGSKKKVDAAAAGKGGPEALAGAQQDLASAKGAAGSLAKNKDKIGGLLKKAGGVRSQVAGARDQIASAKGAVAAVQKGQMGAAAGLPSADKLMKSATDKLGPPADDAAAGTLKGFKVPEKLPQADANVAKADKIVEGLNKPLAAKGALPPAPDAVALNALQGTVGSAKTQAGAVAAPAAGMANALPQAQLPVAQAQKSISAMLAGSGPSVVQLKDGLPKIQSTIGDAQKAMPDPKALQDLAAKVPDVSKIADSSQKGAVTLAKASGPTAAALTSTGTLAAAQTSIESAQTKLPDGAKALTDAAGKMPGVTSPVDAAKGVMDSIQPDGAAKDPERTAVDSLQESVADAQSNATSAADAAGKAKDALPGTQQKIADAQQAAAGAGSASVSPQALQASVAAAQKQAATLAPAMADAQSSAEPLTAGVATAQGKIADLQKFLGSDDDANALEEAQKPLDDLKKAGAPADQIASADAKVQELTQKIDESKPAPAVAETQPPAEDPAKLQADVDATSKQLAAMQKALDVLKQGKAPADQIAAAQAKVQELTKKLDTAKKKAADAKQAAEGSAKGSSDALDAAQKELDALKKSGAPADQIAAAEAKVADLEKQAAAGKQKGQKPTEDEKKTVAEAAAAAQELAAAQKDLDALKASRAPADQIAAAEAKVADLQSKIKPLTTREALLRDQLVPQIDKLVAGAKQQIDTGSKAAADAAAKIESVNNPLNKASDELSGVAQDSTQADLDKLQSQLQQSQTQAQQASAGIQKSSGALTSAQQQVDSGTKATDPSAVKNSVDQAAAGTASVSAAVADAAKAAGDIQKQIQDAQGVLDSVKNGSGPTAEAAAKQSVVEKLEKLVTDLKQPLADAQKVADSAKDKMSAVNDLVAKAKETTDKWPDPAAAQKSIDAAKATLTDLQQKLPDAGKVLADSATAAADAKQSMDEVQKTLAGIQGGTVPADAKQALDGLKSLLDKTGTSLSALSTPLNSDALKKQVEDAQKALGDVVQDNLSADGKDKIASLQKFVDSATKQIGGLASGTGNAAGLIKPLQDQLNQASQLVSGLQSGSISPLDALKQIASDPAVQGLLTQAQQQFPQVSALVSQASDIASQVQAGLTQAQSIATSIQSGDLAGAVQQLASLPAVQGLLADASKQFPEAAALVSQAAAALPAIQQSLAQAGQILGDFQSGNTAAALQQLTSLPIVQDLLGAASRQFPEAAALITQAQGAFAAAQQGLAQANTMLTAFQQGNYADVMSQLSSLPVVQNLLAQAQQEFPAAAALLTTASQYLPAAEAALGQAQDLLSAFQQGTLTPAMITQLPIAQALLGDAEQQLTEFLQQNAPEALQAAAAALPAIQSAITDAQALVAAAQAGDITAVAAALGLGATVAAVQAAAATLTDSPAASAVAGGAPDAAAAAGAVEVGASADADTAAPAGTAASELLLDITTPLGDGVLEIVAIEGEEQISGLFFYKVTCTSEESTLDFTQIMGQPVTVTVDMGDDSDTKRYINGICTRFMQGPQDADENSTYIIELRPWFWQLTLAQDCQIFQSKAVPDIITGIFDALGFSDYTNSTTATYTARDYCVQYRETTFDFISRLMEDEGIFYFFTHADGKHTLVMGDDSDVHVACPSAATVEYDPSENADPGTINYITMEQALTTMQYMMDDFNFETSDTDLKVTVDGTGMKVYEYPGGYATSDAGTTRANNHLGSLEMPAKILKGRSRVRTFSPGYKFTLSEHERDDVNADYVLSRVTLKADQQKYGDEFEAFPAATVFKPPIKTRKPAISGAQTALVVGKSGEEIWTDQYGRIKVQFYWDQIGVKDENSSCWIRVSQGWAGKSWGMVFLPRVGQEVIVSFLEGDPDRPLVTGCVYNAQSTVPYTLPDNQTKSTIKSMSSKSGTIGNEIRFEDLAGSEEMYMYATKDMNIRVVNNMVSGVKASYQMYIQSDDPTVDTSNQYVLVVNGCATTTVKGDSNQETHTNEGKFTQTVAKEFSLTVNGDTLTITTTGDLTIQGKSVTIESTSDDVVIKSAANLTAQSAQSLTNKSGTDLTNQAGTSLTNQAGTSLSNKASVSMTNDGGVSLTNKASASQTVDGGGMLTLKGGMVQIN